MSSDPNPNAELVTGKSRLADNDLRRADRESIADIDCVFIQAFNREILAKNAQGKRAPRQFRFPKLVVFNWIAIDSLVFTAVHRQVRLFIPIQIEPPQCNAAFYRFLENRCGHLRAMPDDFLGQSAID